MEVQVFVLTFWRIFNVRRGMSMNEMIKYAVERRVKIILSALKGVLFFVVRKSSSHAILIPSDKNFIGFNFPVISVSFERLL